MYSLHSNLYEHGTSTSTKRVLFSSAEGNSPLVQSAKIRSGKSPVPDGPTPPKCMLTKENQGFDYDFNIIEGLLENQSHNLQQQRYWVSAN
jgi:hypothetical protein